MLLTTRITRSPKSREVNLSRAVQRIWSRGGPGVCGPRDLAANSVSRTPPVSLTLLDGVVSRRPSRTPRPRREPDGTVYAVFNFRLVKSTRCDETNERERSHLLAAVAASRNRSPRHGDVTVESWTCDAYNSGE